jgi:hypothetical protein
LAEQERWRMGAWGPRPLRGSFGGIRHQPREGG